MVLLSILPAAPLTDEAAASTTVVHSGYADLRNGTLENVTIRGFGGGATVVLARTEVDSWYRQPTPAYPSYRAFCRAATVFGDDKVLLFGGWNGGSHLGDTWLYDLGEGNWSLVEPAGRPEARDDYAMAPVYGTGSIVLFGGGDYLLNDTWVFNATQRNWSRQYPPVSPPGRHNAALSPVDGDDKVVLFGGSDWSGPFNDTWIYDLGDNVWAPIVSVVTPPARDSHALSWVPGDDKVVLFGGNNGWPYLNDTWAFDCSEGQWRRVNSTTAPVQTFGNVLCPLLGTGKLLLYGGQNLGNQTWFFDIASGSWVQVTTRGVSYGRTDYAMAPVWDTDQAVLFGGYAGGFRDSTWLFNFSGFRPEGWYTGQPVGLGGPADLRFISWNATLPAGTDVSFQLRSALSPQALAAAPFTGPDGTSGTYYIIPGEGLSSGHAGDSQLQYRVRLRTERPEASPVLACVTVDANLWPDAPEPLLPSGGGWANGTAAFSWLFRDNDSAQPGGYRLQADDDEAFGSVDYDSGEVDSAAQCATAPLGEGDHFWRVRTRDAEGAWGPYCAPRAVRVDASAPNVTIITPPAGLLGTTSFTLFGTADDRGSGISSVECRADAGPWRPCNGTSNWRVDLDLPAGPHSVEVRAWDAAGNRATARVNYTVNRPPEVNLTSPAEGGRYNVTDRLELSAEGSDPDGDDLTFIWKDGPVALGTGRALSALFGAGDHTVTVSVSDGRGNLVVRAVNFTVYSAVPLPAVQILSPREKEVLRSSTVQVNFSVLNFSISPTAGGPHLAYRLSGGGEQAWYSSSSFVLDDVDNGPHNLTIWLVDGEGRNLSAPGSRATVNFTVNDPDRNLPDLVLSAADLSIRPEMPNEGDEVSMTFRVFNRGLQSASTFTVRLYVDGNDTAEKTFRALDAGANSTGKLVWRSARGVHDLRLTVDPSNEIPERNETNNEVGFVVEVGGPVPAATAGQWPVWGLALLLLAAIIAGLAVLRGRGGSRGRPAGGAGAAVRGAPDSGLKPLDGLFAIEDIFLIYRDGRLIQHASRRLTAGEDSSEIMASMLTAVQTFIQDALSRGQQAVLGGMEYSGRKILLEADRNLILAAVISGPEPDGLRNEMAQTLRNIEAEFSPLLPGWDGDIVALSGTRRFLTALGKFRSGELSELERHMESQLPTDVKVMSEVEFYQGFARLKVAVRNEGDMLVADAALDLHFNEEILRLDRVEPAYQMSGKRVVLGNLGPKEKKTVAYYLDPQICTESAVDGVLTYRDAKGEFKTVPLRRRMVTVVCPILHTEENINTAMLRRLISEELDQRDSKLFVVPARLPMQEAFGLGKRSVEGHDVRFVREFVEREPHKAEAWYFGKTKAREAKLVIRVCARGEGRTLEFFVASGSRLAVTGLLAELRSDLVKRQKETAPAVHRMEQVVDLALKERLDAERPLLEKYADGA